MAASGSLIFVLTIARAAGLAVLATEALFLWSRRRESSPEQQGPVAARFFWAATPAAILAGLALWCMASVAPSRGVDPQRIAMQQQHVESAE